MNKIITISELTEERYIEIDSLLTNSELNDSEDVSFDELLNNYIESIEAIQARFAHHGIDCPEQYQYLLSIMLTNA